MVQMYHAVSSEMLDKRSQGVVILFCWPEHAPYGGWGPSRQ